MEVLERAPRAQAEFLTSDDLHLFNEGTHLCLHEKLGAHLLTRDGVDGVHFGVWAPNAARVSVIGDFNAWDKSAHPLNVRADSGIWTGFIAGLEASARYKFHIISKAHNYEVDKADPFGFTHEIPPATASLVWD